MTVGIDPLYCVLLAIFSAPAAFFAGMAADMALRSRGQASRALIVAFSPFAPAQKDGQTVDYWVQLGDLDPPVTFFHPGERTWLQANTGTGVGYAIVSGHTVTFRALRFALSERIMDVVWDVSDDRDADYMDVRTLMRLDAEDLITILEACGTLRPFSVAMRRFVANKRNQEEHPKEFEWVQDFRRTLKAYFCNDK